MNRRDFFKAIATTAAGLVVARYLPKPAPKPDFAILKKLVEHARAHEIKPIKSADGSEWYGLVLHPSQYDEMVRLGWVDPANARHVNNAFGKSVMVMV